MVMTPVLRIFERPGWRQPASPATRDVTAGSEFHEAPFRPANAAFAAPILPVTPDARRTDCDRLASYLDTEQTRETPMKEQRGITIHFTDGSKISMDFPKQSPSEIGAMMKLNDVLEKRHMLFEADSTLLMVPFENVKYVQIYPAPAEIAGQTYVKGASIKD
jgi:hypothetical protein